MGWKIDKFERSELDFEELRLFFSPACIQKALEKHLEKYGANKLSGVTYQQVLK